MYLLYACSFNTSLGYMLRTGLTVPYLYLMPYNMKCNNGSSAVYTDKQGRRGYALITEYTMLHAQSTKGTKQNKD